MNAPGLLKSCNTIVTIISHSPHNIYLGNDAGGQDRSMGPIMADPENPEEGASVE